MDTFCFHILPIVINAAMNFGMHVSFWISVFVFFRYISSSGIAGSYGTSIFSLLWTSILFSIVAAPVYIPTNSISLSILQKNEKTCSEENTKSVAKQPFGKDILDVTCRLN